MGKRLFEEFSPVSKKVWKEKLIKDLKGRPYEKLIKLSAAGISVEPLYTSDDLSSDSKATFPGTDDFRRGSTSLVHANKRWELCQSLHLESVAAVMDYLAAEGDDVESIRLNLDSALQNGLNSNPAKQGRFRENDGLWINDWTEIQPIIDWAKSNSKKLWIAAGDASADLLTKDHSDLLIGMDGGLCYNPLVFGAKDKAWIEDLANCLKKEGFHDQVKLIEIDLTPWELGSASGTDQMAFGLAMAVELATQLAAFDLTAEEVFKRISFRFPIGTEFLTEIAKIRAFRSLLASVLGAYGLELPGEYFHIQACPAASSETVADPQVNLLRATTEAMTAIFAGCELISLPAYDHLYAAPNNLSMRIARNIHLVLREESNLGKVIDPAGGAYFVEHATDEMAEKAWLQFQSIEAKGGWSNANQSGELLDALAASQSKRDLAINRAKKVLLGTNMYPKGAEHLPNTIPAPTLKNSGNLAARLQALSESRKIEIQLPAATRAGAGFETLRRRMQAYEKGGGKASKVLLLAFGNPAMRSARVNFSRNLFAAAGFTCQDNQDADDLATSLQEVATETPGILVLCASDKDYASQSSELIEAVKANSPHTVIILAGKPEGWEAYREIGLHDCISAGMNRFEFLENMMNTLNIGKELRHEA